MFQRKIQLSLVCLIGFLVVSHAHAYVGPGLGMGAIGAVLGLILSAFVVIFALFWYPIKRMLNLYKRKKVKGKDANQRHDEVSDKKNPADESESSDGD